MLDRSWMRRIALAAAAGCVALALVALPLAPGAALAKSGGSNGAGHSGGKSGGKGHGKGGKGGPDTTTFVDSDGDSHGKGHTGHGKGHSKDAVSGVHSSDNGDEDGATSDLLGRLNAAHASPNAMANAAPHSAVGLTAKYYDALADALATEGMSEVEAEAVAMLFAELANKEVAESEVGVVVREYNRLLGIDIGAYKAPAAGEEADHYAGFTIELNTENDLVGVVTPKLGDPDIGGGLGPPPEE